jgi:adenosylhomocysteine nucleosidase
MSAAQKQFAEAQAKASAGPDEGPPTCDFALVFALAVESGGLVDLLSEVSVVRGDGFKVRRGLRHSRTIALAESGAGRANAAKAAHALIDAYRPRWLFSAGFAGALAPELQHGQVIVAREIVDTAGQAWTGDPQHIPPWLSDVPGVRVDRLLCVDHVVRSPEEKLSLGRKHQALAADMESLAVALVCEERKVPFLAVRAISDAVEDRLPAEVEHLLDQKTTAARLGSALGSIWRRPGSIKDLWQLKESALAASDRLGRLLAGMMKHL